MHDTLVALRPASMRRKSAMGVPDPLVLAMVWPVLSFNPVEYILIPVYIYITFKALS